MVNAFEGNGAETTTMLPTLKAFMAAHGLHDIVIVADAGMISEKNMRAIEAEGLSFILGMKIPEVPYVVRNGGSGTRTRRSRMGTSSPSPGPPGRRTSVVTKSGTTSTRAIGPAARSRASTSKSARPNRPWPARSR